MPPRVLAFAALVHAAALTVSLAGQSTRQAAPPQEPRTQQLPSRSVFRSAVGIVALTVTVQDSQSRYVTGLSRDDFAVFENGVRQPIRLFEAAGT